MIYSRNVTRVVVRYLAALLGILVLGILVVCFQTKPAAAATCADSLQAKIDAAPAGGTVTANPCVYRQQVTITKPLTLKGQPGSEIRGSDVWTGWTYSGGYWRSSKTLPSFPHVTSVTCNANTYLCKWPEQVFFDGGPLRQVGANPGAGQFAVDSGRRVVLKDDPRGRFVEVSVRRQWVVGKADNVTVRGFAMRHAANTRGMGALTNNYNSGWTVEGNTLADAHAAIVRIYDHGFRLLNNDIYRGGQLGVHASGQNILVQGNQVHHNNTEDFTYSGGVAEAGGMKLLGVSGTSATSNRVYNNKGNGIHFDIDCSNNTISNNRVFHNARKGIQYELSRSGKIFDNVLWENGWATPANNDGAGITLHNSSTTEVYGNTLAWNADGIAVFALDREGTTHDRVHDVYVHNNTVLGKNSATEAKNHIALGWFQGWAKTLFDPINNNRGVYNRYWYTTSESSLERYRWIVPPILGNLAAFNLTRGEENGRYLTKSEKDAVVVNKGIPANPQLR